MASETLVIKADQRTDTTGSTTTKLRKEGMIPGTVYGKSGVANIAVPAKTFPAAHTLSKTLTLDLGSAKKTVLMREVQIDIFSTNPIHVDFQEVSPSDVVLCQVPVEYIGLTKEQEKEASFKVLLRNIKVKGPVSKLPEKFVVDVGHLKSGESVHGSNLDLPEGVKLRVSKTVALASLSRS